MNIIKNLNPKKNPITDLLGLIAFLLSLAMFSLPLFITLKEEPNIYVSSGIGVVGLLLMLAPDKIVTILIQPLVRLFTKEKEEVKSNE